MDPVNAVQSDVTKVNLLDNENSVEAAAHITMDTKSSVSEACYSLKQCNGSLDLVTGVNAAGFNLERH